MARLEMFFNRAKALLWHPAVGLLILAVLFGAWYLLIREREPSLIVQVVHEGVFSETVHVSGEVEATSNVDLGFSQSGRVAHVYAEVGQKVARGTILAEIENDDLRAALMQRQAALDSQKAKLASLQEGTRPEQIAVTQAQVDSDTIALQQANHALVDAIQSAYTTSDATIRNIIDPLFNNPHSYNPQITFTVTDSNAKMVLESDRVGIEAMLHGWLSQVGSLSSTNISAALDAAQEANSNLSQVGKILSDANVALNAAITNSQLSQAQLTAWVEAVGGARSTINAAISSLTAAVTAQRNASALLVKDQKNLDLQKAGTTSSELDAQIAAVSAASADLNSARAQLEKTIIRAPFDGTITRMDAKVGAVLSPNTPEISLISDGVFRIIAYVPEVDIANISVGNSATTTLDAYGDQVFFPATVVAIDPAQTSINGITTYKTTLQFLERDSRVRSGMTASVMITTSAIPGAIAVPQSAVIREGDKTFIEVQRGDDIERREVTVGSSTQIGEAEITAGLHEGETIVLNP